MRLGKKHLLEIAEQLFTEHGYQAVSIRDIARASGVTNAALYYHFPSKEALFDEVIENHAEKLAERLQKASTETDIPREQLVAMLTELSTHIPQRRPPLFSLPRKPDKIPQDQIEKQHALLVRKILAPLERVLQTAVERGELRPLSDEYSPAALLLGLLHGMTQHRKHTANCQPSQRDIELVIDIFWDGLKC